MSEAPDPNPFPEFRLFRSQRLRDAADFVGNVAHVLFDTMRHPTPSEHFRPVVTPNTEAIAISREAHPSQVPRNYDSEGTEVLDQPEVDQVFEDDWHKKSGW